MKAFERKRGRIPKGSVVMVRSDWSKKWTEDPAAAKALAADPNFPGVSLDALKFLHRKRHILFHGHEPLDTDTTPTLEGEAWLMHHGYTQAEGVDNLAAVPQVGCLVDIGYPKFAGGLGGYARYVAICPPKTKARHADLGRGRAAAAQSTARCTGTSSAASAPADRRRRGARPRAPSSAVDSADAGAARRRDRMPVRPRRRPDPDREGPRRGLEGDVRRVPAGARR